MGTTQIHVFVSHSWTYSQHYNTLESWIFQEEWRSGSTKLDLRNYSVPKTDPILGASSDKQLREAIYKQISMSHVIVIPTGMYAHYSKWIGKEIEGATYYGKPILAVDLWRSQRASSIVTQASTMSAAWNKKSVIDGIWKLYNTG